MDNLDDTRLLKKQTVSSIKLVPIYNNMVHLLYIKKERERELSLIFVSWIPLIIKF